MTKPLLRILFTSAGRRVELTRCFREAAQRLGAAAEIHACDLNPMLSSACRDADFRFGVPRCDDPEYVDRVLAYCAQQGIDLLVPTIDTELLPLALARPRFEAVGTYVHVSSPETIDIVRDKARTVEVLGAAGVPVPRSAPVEDVRNNPRDWPWPLFIKPAGGSASRGIGKLNSADDIMPSYIEPMIVQEFLKGPEYTINIYVDEGGEMRAAIPHLRLSTRAGEVEKGRTERRVEFTLIARQLVAALPKPRGVLCFQLIDDPERGPKVFEINARFGGGYPLADHAGGCFAESLLSMLLGRGETADDEWRDGVTMLRYDAAIFDG